MGTVFKALDTHLDRYVALKVLRADLKVDAQSRARLTQEAKAASALNHPNIVHIYDVGTEGGVDYIAMEYISGKTLDEVITGRGLSIDESLNYAIQIADALDVAHREGIVHRDLKPGNIMITERNLVKVLDFGLAKLTEHASAASVSSIAPTQIMMPQTIAGQTLGTPYYMSPEQAEGRMVDTRTDIFSFGIVLYQMLSGALPFTGTSTFAVLASVLRDEPKSLAQVAPGVPEDLDHVVTRCLRKDVTLRYRTMDDIRSALEDLRQRRLVAHATGRVDISALPRPTEKTSLHSNTTGPLVAVPQASPVEPEAVRPQRNYWVWPLVAVIIVGASAASWYKLNRPPAKAPDRTPVRLTFDESLDTTPAISPDGTLLAYASDRAGEGYLDLWVKQVGGSGTPVRLTADRADASMPVFSPDGKKIAFRSERDGGGIYMISSSGGGEKLIVAGGWRPRFSPDGTKIAFYTQIHGNSYVTRPGWVHMFVVDASGGTPAPIRADFAAAAYPLFTPDGQHLLFLGIRAPNSNQTSSWWVTPLGAGDPIDTGFRSALVDDPPIAWHGNKVVYSQTEKNGADTGSDIREIEISTGTWKVIGEPRKLTFDTTRDEFPSLASDGTLVFSSLVSNVDIYSLPMNTDQPQPHSGVSRLTKSPAFESVRDISEDGRKIVFLSDRSGHLEVWGRDLMAGVERKLSDGPTIKRQPVITRNGEWVAYAENGDGPNPIYMVPFSGGPAKLICDRCGTQSGWSADGKSLLMTDYQNPPSPILTLDVETGKITEVLRHPRYGLFPRSASPDGRWVSFSEDRGSYGTLLAVAPFRPGNPAPQSEWIYLTDGKSQDYYPRWSSDCNTVYYASTRGGRQSILAQRLNPAKKNPEGDPIVIYSFSGASPRLVESTRWISVARDKIVFSLEERSGSIWMLHL